MGEIKDMLSRPHVKTWWKYTSPPPPMSYVTALMHTYETRMKKRQDTCAAFINFSKAYDRIDRIFLWRKLEAIGIGGIF